jgi:hypothetical protein
MEAFARALFGIFQVKLTGIEYDVYKVISMNCDIETQLQLRSVSQGFRSLIKEVNPDLFRQLLEQSYICSNRGELCSAYSHLFPNNCSPNTLEGCIHIPSILIMNYYKFPHYIVRRLRSILDKVIDQADIETDHGYILTLMYAFMTGENILEK